MNQMSDKEKLALSFLLALTVPWGIALMANLFVRNPLFLLAVGLALSAYTLKFGLQKNEAQERSVGVVFGQLTPWVIPTGISWWIPAPFGAATLKTPTTAQPLDHTREQGKHLTMVETSDGAQVEVSYYGLYVINDIIKWVSVENAAKAVDSTVDRAIRWFVNEHPVEGITKKKAECMSHLMETLGKTLLNDYGVTMKSIRIDDINPPKSIVEANEAEAREQAEGRREKRDMGSVRARVLELMWGDAPEGQTLEAYASAQEGVGKNPLMTYKEALNTVRAARGDIRVIDVQGGGDFAKGAAIQTDTGGKKK